MSDREFENYLALLSGLLKLSKSQREAIAGELQDHLDQRLSALLDQGVSHDDAVTMALEEFGDVAQLAAELTRSGRRQTRRWVMRLTMGSLAAAAAVVFVAMALWPSPDAGPAPDRALAQTVVDEPPDDSLPGQPEKPANNRFDEVAISVAARNAESAKSRDDLLSDKTAAKLRELVPVLFDETPLREALNELGERLEVQFYVDGRALQDEAITPNEPVSIELGSVPADMLLELMLRQLNLAYMIRSGIVIITTPEEAEVNLVVHVYDVNDLLMPAPDSAGGSEKAADGEPHPGREMSFGELPTAALNRMQVVNDRAVIYRQRADTLIDLITTCIMPDSWDHVGGPASVQLFGGALVVSQTSQTHRQIAELLPAIRAVIKKNPDIPMRSAENVKKGNSEEAKGAFN